MWYIAGTIQKFCGDPISILYAEVLSPAMCEAQVCFRRVADAKPYV